MKRGIDFSHAFADSFAVFLRHVPATDADEVHDARLEHGLRKGCFYGLWELFRTVGTQNEDILQTAASKLTEHLKPEFATFGILKPKAQYVFGSLAAQAYSDIDGAVLNAVVLSRLDDHRVESDGDVHGLQRPRLPCTSPSSTTASLARLTASLSIYTP